MSGGIYGRCHGCGSGRVLKSRNQQACPKCGKIWGTWEVRVKGERIRHDARGMRISGYDHAQLVLDTARYELTLGTWDRSRYSKKLQAKYVFKNVVGDYLAHLEKRHRTSGTPTSGYLYEIEQALRNHFIPLIGSYDVRDIIEHHLEQCQIRLLEDLQPSSVNTFFSMLGALFTWAHRSRLIERRPLMPHATVQRKVTPWLDSKAQDAIWEHIDAPYRPYFDFLRYHGTRLKEARELRWEDVDVTRELIVIRNTKTRRDRVIPISPLMIDWFRENRGFGLVFKGFGNGIKKMSAHQAFKRACRAAGIEGVREYNATRHSWASQMRDAGASIEDISAVLGHTNTQITERHYAFPSISAGKRTIGKVKKLDQNKVKNDSPAFGAGRKRSK